MTISIDAKNSGPGPRPVWGWEYPASHEWWRRGEVLSYWLKAASWRDIRNGAAVIIRRAE